MTASIQNTTNNLFNDNEVNAQFAMWAAPNPDFTFQAGNVPGALSENNSPTLPSQHANVNM